jgi:hypothetical protein
MQHHILSHAIRILERYNVTLEQITVPTAREALERIMFDGDLCRDDVAAACERLEDATEKQESGGTLVRDRCELCG